MLSVAAAAEIINRYWPPGGVTWGQLADLPRGVLAESVTADRDYPPGDRVMMDGIALLHSTYSNGQRSFPVLGTIAAGDTPVSLTDPFACWEVMTGALLPPPADLVIPYEDITLVQEVAQVTQDRQRQPLEFVHRQGSDCLSGAEILPAGTPLNGPIWGILASLGKTQVKLTANPRIQIIATGDELVSVEQIPQAQQLRCSNVYALQASLQHRGFSHITLAHLADDPLAIRQHYQQATSIYDVLIYSGGISRGKFDYLPSLWQEMGAELYIQGVAQKPGKPLCFGIDNAQQTLIVGLPGNPVSSLICLHRYFLPNPLIYAQLATEVKLDKPLTYFLPVKLIYTEKGTLKATPLPMQNSGDFIALAPSDGFLELPPGPRVFSAGECFRFFAW